MDVSEIKAIIDKEIQTEGHPTDDPLDSGGKTVYGMSQAANPDLFDAQGHVDEQKARERYAERYIKPFEGIRDSGLLHQMVDFGVTTGVETAVKVLQQTVGVTADGLIGPNTIQAVEDYPRGTVFGVLVPGFVMLNLAVRDARILFYSGITKRFPKNLRFLLGWLKRAMEFK